ncbi:MULTISPECIES: MopE-related protein [Sandaracinus]|uniref:MopE-related protein n=1 Tax=Sandaracinus TaxID=1055688 RepID=UPI0019D4403E|nr:MULTISPECIES: MopE-related protein [Sandaracinus]QRN75732.1 Hypothetical protein MSR10575_88190 [Sandaracinus sp.]UJR87215.1 Hypothetical protein I5071_060 [Sandaracinus amylolyticus]
MSSSQPRGARSRVDSSFVVAALLAITFLLTSCSPSRTALRLVIDSTTLAVPEDVDFLEIEVVGLEGGNQVRRDVQLTRLPQTLDIRAGEVENGAVRVTITALRDGAFVVRRVVRARFMPGAVQQVPVVLFSVCRGIECDVGIDCMDGVCQTPLREECVEDSDCDDGVACTHDWCDDTDDRCSHEADSSVCVAGAECHPIDGCRARECASDDECVDDHPCDGAERCVGSACVIGERTSCRDGDPCTTDRCLNSLGGGCVYSTRDRDDDDHADASCEPLDELLHAGDDCDDTNPNVHPDSLETCNGIDDDCDDGIDNHAGSECVDGSSRSCATMCDPIESTSGMQDCVGCRWAECVPPLETCNDADDDCDSRFDEGDGRTCRAGTTGTCRTDCDTEGTQACSTERCVWEPTCTPPNEVCNGSDEDCDDSADEGVGDGCVQNTSTQSCTTLCNSTGTWTCGRDCRWPTSAADCVVPDETCNGFDDDCDDAADEGCPSCIGCTGAFPVSNGGDISHWGGRYGRPVQGTSAHRPRSCGKTGAGDGPEAVLTLTLDETSDVFITTHQAIAMGIDTVVYVRECACGGTEIACNDDAGGFPTSALTLTNRPRGTYHIFVDTPAGTNATIPIDVYVSAPSAASDGCGNPTYVPLGASVSGTTVGFTHDYDVVNVGLDNEPHLCPYPQLGNGADRVFYVVVPEARVLTASECNTQTLYDSMLYVRSVCESDLGTSQLACGDDSCEPGSSGCAWYRPRASVMVQPGVYYVFVDTGQISTCQSGAFRLDIAP